MLDTRVVTSLLSLIIAAIVPSPTMADLQAVAVPLPQGVHVEIHDGKETVFTPINRQASLLVIQPAQTTGIVYKETTTRDGVLRPSGGSVPGLDISETYRNLTPDLIERTVTVTAKTDQRFYLDFGWKDALGGDFYSFLQQEKGNKPIQPKLLRPRV